MFTIETVEVHLDYLRKGLDQVTAALPLLRDKIDKLAADMDAKLEKISAKMDAQIARLDARIDRLESKFDRLESKLERLQSDMADVRAYQKALFWLISAVGIVCAALSAADKLGWV